LNELIKAGKVRYIGCSNFTAWQLTEAYWLAEKYGLEKYVTIQNQYNLLARQNEWSITEVTQRYGGIGLLPWSPLAGGLLSGKYDRNNPESVEGSRAQWADSFGWTPTSLKEKRNEQFFKIIDELKAVAKEINSTPAAVALRWLVQQQAVSSVIIGARSVEQLEKNLAAADIELNQQQMERLDGVSAPLSQKPYPYGFIETANGSSRHRETRLLTN